MADRKPEQRNSSRTMVIGVVVLLIVIAVAGIVLAGRRNPMPAPGTAAALPDVPASTAAAASGPTSGANEVVFEAGSDKLPVQASDSIARFAEGARGLGGTVRISARYLTGADKARDLEVARNRTAAVRHALESDGVKAGQLQVELIEMPAGALQSKDADRVELSLR